MIKMMKWLIIIFVVFVVISVTVGVPIVNKIVEANNKIIIKELIKNGCTNYFDGCNDCQVYTNGEITCTLVGCVEINKAKCNVDNGPIIPLLTK